MTPAAPLASGDPEGEDTAWPWSRKQQYYALAVLFAIGLVNYIDRVAFSVLQVPIKAELRLSDTEIGTLTGFAFFIPYLLLSMPMARLADRSNRKYLLMGALALWGSMTAATGLAQSFGMIAILRMGVAMGEACCLPAVYSLIADFFQPKHRARAIAIFGMAYSLGSMVGLAGAGLLEARLGWNGAFVVIGCAGLALLPIIALTFREPSRGDAKTTAEVGPPPSLGQALLILWRLKSFRYASMAASLQAFVAVTILFWAAPFYVRSHQVPLEKIAVELGLIVGIAGAVGTLVGGLLGDKLGRHDSRWYLRLPGLTSALTVPFGLVAFLAGNLTLSIIFLTLTIMVLNMWLSPTYAIAQSLVRPNMRALISATLVTSTAIVSGAIGPSVIGSVSDALGGSQGFGQDSLRVAISLAVLVSAPVAGLFFVAARHVRTDLGETGLA